MSSIHRVAGLLFTVAIVAAAGCLDLTVAQGNCKEGEIVDPDPGDCIKQVCRGGAEVNEPDDTEVPDDKNPCSLDSCAGGTPQHTPAEGACTLGGKAGTCVMGKCEIACQQSGECNDDNKCTTDICNGTTKTCDFTKDDALTPDDMNPCTTDSCKAGVESHVPDPGAACGMSGKCDKNGVCIGCTQDADCPPDDDCNDWACVNQQCKSTFTNEGLPVAAQNMGDCQVKVCQMGQVVSQPDDSDKPVDGNDCTEDVCKSGVSSNPASISGKACVAAGTSGQCDGAGTCTSCVNGIKDGNEGDIDCGGSCPSKCNTGQGCNVGADCVNGVCNAGKCAGPSCSDTVKNGQETDIDCGGGTCPKCSNGKLCTKAADCQSNNCTGGTCK